MVKLHTFSDAMTDNVDDTGVWTDTPGTGTVQEQNGHLELIPPASSGSQVSAIRESINSYDLTGSYAYAQMTLTGGAQADRTSTVGVNLDANNRLRWRFNNGLLTPQKVLATVATAAGGAADLTYDIALHDWQAVWESGGTVHWSYSGDGITWTDYATELVSGLFAVTALIVRFQALETATGAAPPITAYKNFNTGATAPPMTPAGGVVRQMLLYHHGG